MWKIFFWAHNTTLFLQYSYGNDILFLFYLLLSLDLKSFASGSAVGTLNRNYIHQMFVSYPNLLEQKKIANYIKAKHIKIDQAIEKAEKEITLVKEYLQSLIYQVVTGRLAID